VPRRHRLQVAVVIRIAKVRLQHVVIDVTDRELCLDPVQTYGLELEIGHGPRRILRQRLIDAQAHLFTRGHPSLHEVLGNDLGGQGLGHGPSFPKDTE